MFIVLTLIVAVAAFNIVSALVTMVRNKRGDIAILRAMGATGGAITRAFLLQGMLIAALGVLAVWRRYRTGGQYRQNRPVAGEKI